MPNQKPRIGVLMGDPAGIGPEVALKALAQAEVHELCRPLLIGDYDLLCELTRQLALPISLIRRAEWSTGATGAPKAVEVLHVPHGEEPIPLGMNSRGAGELALRCIRRAFDLAQRGEMEAIAMAPLNKESLAMAGAGYHSEFELFADLAGVPIVKSVTKAGAIFRISVTGHIAFREIVARLNAPEIAQDARLLSQTLARFGIAQPRLAVAALNPHAGEGGLFGDEEARIIVPALQALRAEGFNVQGPIPADTIFVRALKGEFDGLIYLYHDQGNIAMKAACFGAGVVIYAGLPLVIVTPSHGSAYDIAGRGIADAGNMLEALRTAAALAS